MEKSNKKLDLLVIFIILAITVTIWYVFNLKPLWGGALMGLLPSLYLTLREKKNWLKIFWAVVILGGLYGFVFDFIETFNKAWFIKRLVIPWRILGVLPWDDVIGFLIMTFFIVVFYEHFVDDEKNKRISKNIIWALMPPVLVGIVIVLFSIISGGEVLMIHNVYLTGGIAAIIIPLALGFYKPMIFLKILSTAAFFFVVWFVAEIIALKTGAWVFFGEYIGKVTVFGVTFPFEELFFWMMLYAGSVVLYYEFFIDDMK